jgi:hypothetical protein
VNAETADVKFSTAEQATDISWTAFQNNIFDINKNEFGLTPAGNWTGVGVYGSTTNKIAGTDESVVRTVVGSKGYFYPITINTAKMDLPRGTQWKYDGKNHSISDVEVYLPSESLFSGAGLFAEFCERPASETPTVGQKYAVQNLQLIDFSVKSEKAGADAGALAGKISQAEVTNVVAFHKTKEGDNANPDNANPTGIAATKSVSGTANAGGLVGYASNSNLLKSAAALKVSTSGDNGGGLAGFVNGMSEIISCFSGGHTIDGEYKPDHGSGDDKVTNDYNVKAALNAGGLIGKADDASDVTTIRYSYSTCSAMATGTDGGTAVGGLLGRLVNGESTVNFCYATGLVKANPKAETSDGEAPSVGAFIGDLPNVTGKVGNSYYYQIINKTTGADGTVTYLPQFGVDINHHESLVTAIDKSADAYDAFVGASGSWSSSYSYDAKLKVFYQGKYNLETTNQLLAKRGGTDSYNGQAGSDDFVRNHYGDWPAPETWVFNTKN